MNQLLKDVYIDGVGTDRESDVEFDISSILSNGLYGPRSFDKVWPYQIIRNGCMYMFKSNMHDYNFSELKHDKFSDDFDRVVVDGSLELFFDNNSCDWISEKIDVSSVQLYPAENYDGIILPIRWK